MPYFEIGRSDKAGKRSASKLRYLCQATRRLTVATLLATAAFCGMLLATGQSVIGSRLAESRDANCTTDQNGHTLREIHSRPVEYQILILPCRIPSARIVGLQNIRGVRNPQQQLVLTVPTWILLTASLAYPLALVAVPSLRKRIRQPTIHPADSTKRRSILRSLIIAFLILAAAGSLILAVGTRGGRWPVTTWPKSITIGDSALRWILNDESTRGTLRRPTAGAYAFAPGLSFGYLQESAGGNRNKTVFTGSISFWWVAALFAAYPCYDTILRLLHRRRPGHCLCGYDLHGNKSGVCPECGLALTAA